MSGQHESVRQRASEGIVQDRAVNLRLCDARRISGALVRLALIGCGLALVVSIPEQTWVQTSAPVRLARLFIHPCTRPAGHPLWL
jgi:hypothetical protein